MRLWFRGWFFIRMCDLGGTMVERLPPSWEMLPSSVYWWWVWFTAVYLLPLMADSCLPEWTFSPGMATFWKNTMLSWFPLLLLVVSNEFYWFEFELNAFIGCFCIILVMPPFLTLIGVSLILMFPWTSYYLGTTLLTCYGFMTLIIGGFCYMAPLPDLI